MTEKISNLFDVVGAIPAYASGDQFLMRDVSDSTGDAGGTAKAGTMAGVFANIPTLPILNYNGTIDATNYERAFARWASNVFEIGAEKGGTGTQRLVQLNINGTGNTIEGEAGQNVVHLRVGGSYRLNLSSAGMDLGAWRSGLGVKVAGTSAGGGNSNRAADSSIYEAGLGTGNGAFGAVVHRAAPSLTSGTTLHTAEDVTFSYVITTGQPMQSFGGLTSAFPAWRRVGAEVQVRLADDSAYADLRSRKLYVDATNTAGGTTGDQTINKASGTVNFAAAATSLTVTNSLVTTASIILCVVRTNDTTADVKNVVPGSGSFVITLSAAATAETSVGFVVVN